jgi:hypothetical protein
MDPKYLPVDQRFIGSSVYCGEVADTQEHVPKNRLDGNSEEIVCDE